MTLVSNAGTGDPVFDYSSRDYAAIYGDLVSRIPVYLPEWTSRSQSDFGLVMLQMYSYVGDILNYYLDRLAGEAFIQTATQPDSIINLAAMLDYQPTLATGSTATLLISLSPAVTSPVTIPAGTAFSTQASPTTPAIQFITTAALTIAAPGTLTGTVNAVQGTIHTGEAVGTSDGSINQSFALKYNPVSAGVTTSDPDLTVYVDLGDGNGASAWSYTTSIIDYQSNDKVYTTYVDANSIMYITFGDNVNGYVPPIGSPITATYRTTVGYTGNVGSGTIVQPVGAVTGLASVTNQAVANGGADAESLASIQSAAPAALKALNRGVTISDVQTLAMQVPGVLWAAAIESTYQLVNLYICPFGGGNLVLPVSGSPTAGTLAYTALGYVQPKMMANTTVKIMSPSYAPVLITANVAVYANYNQTTVTNNVQTALSSLLAVSNSLNTNNTGFGFRVALGLVYSTVLAVDGVNWANISTLTRTSLTTITTLSPTGSLFVSPLPEQVSTNDPIAFVDPTTGNVLGNAVAASSANVGATTLSVTSGSGYTYTPPSGGYPVGTIIRNLVVNDVVTLAYEIPVATAAPLIIAIPDTFSSPTI